MSEASFSVIVAAYQAAGTIGRAVGSALEQTAPAHEVIVVDDGSTDDLGGALAPFGDAVTLIRQDNRGAGAARNTAAAAASGEFIVVLDADDAYHPRRLEALGALARERPELDLITTDARLIVDGSAVGTFADHTPFVTEGQRTAIFESCFVGGWPALRLSRFRAIGGFDETLRIAQDWDCWLRAVLDGAEAGFVGEAYYDYFVHADSLSSSRAAALWERARMLEKAARNPALREDERPALERALRMHRSRAVMADVQAALYGSAPRLRLARHALARRLQPRVR
ncbi:MAG TPA: glycosyltransferase family A protein, partial [Solirubrobacterales bacterium]|nr:glycosyltransferase family A protein [Solirubrobacterales bacterium]